MIISSNKVLLIDVDSTIPNLALMKLSAYYKLLGYEIDLIRLNIPYYPNKVKKVHNVDTSGYNLVFGSCIFTDNYKYVKGLNIIWGGTGYDFKISLDLVIENIECDYLLYDNITKTYDFITRGCIRNCYFCFVPQKEGKLHKVKDVSTIIKSAKDRGHKEIMFLDNNILAYAGHSEVLQKLVDSRLKVDLNQGLDVRLLDTSNQMLLSKLKYQREYIFAFDSWSYKKVIDSKMELLKAFGSWKVKFYIYIHPNMSLSETIKRVEYCKNHKYLPYIMRDITCWSSEYNEFYIDISAYCNQPSFFKKMSFQDFLLKRHVNINRIKSSSELYINNELLGGN